MPVILFSDEGDEIELPSKKEVCWRCKGEGSITNPAIGAITMDQWWNEWDDDSRDMYMRGDYDVPCEMCNGLRVVDVIDELRCDPLLLKQYEAQEIEVAESRAIEAQERAMGA